ncbi:MAG: YdjY domain-containing protein [Phycisphaerales bacterium JB050]
MMRLVASSLLLSATTLVGCAAVSPREWPSPDHPIVIDTTDRTVRFSGIVPIAANERPMLEVLVCTPDSREHEALVMTRVRASHVHAALIALGAAPGEPGGLVWDGDGFILREPSGPRIRVRFNTKQDDRAWTDAGDWFITDPETPIDRHWLFTGSAEHKAGYAADSDGVIVGLVSFTTEVIGLSRAITDLDHDRAFDFFPNPERVPAFGTPVVVELRWLD